MRLNHLDALRILGLGITVTFNEIKLAYRKACSIYHPDRNPAGLEMMKLINAAWSALSDFVEGSIKGEEEQINLGEEMNIALNAIIHLGLEIEICGSWIWVSGNTRTHKEILKQAGYRWAPKKMMWHWRPEDYKGKGRGKYTIDEIRGIHGSEKIKNREFLRVG